MPIEMSLLDDLCLATGYAYLSDLRTHGAISNIAKILRTFPADAYPLKDWNDAISYLLSDNRAYTSCASAKAHLLSELYK